MASHANPDPPQAAQRISDTLVRLPELPELAALIRRLGRDQRAAQAPARPAQSGDSTASRQFGLKAVETRLLAYDSEAVLTDGRPDPAQPSPAQPPREASAPPQPEALERARS